MKLYYINLDSQPQRRRRIEGQLAQFGLAGERIAALTPDQVPRDILHRYCSRGLLPPSAAEMACNLSHVEAMKKIAAGTPRYGLILEDDAILSAELPMFLSEIERDERLFDLIKLDGPHHAVRVLSRGAERVAGVDLLRVLSDREAATAYLLSREAAQRIIEHPRTPRRPIDLVLFDTVSSVVRGLKIRHVTPALAAAPEHIGAINTDSTLDEARHQQWKALSRLGLRRVHLRYALHRDLLVGSRKTALSLLFGGSHKQEIPFSPDLLQRDLRDLSVTAIS